MGYFPTHTRVDLHAIAAKAGSLFPEEVTNLALKSVKHLNVSPTKREEILETIVESVEPVIVVSALMNEVTQPIVTKAVNVYRTVTETGINQQPINARAPQKGNSLRANYNPYAGTSRSADIARGEAKKALKELATSKGYDINDPKVSETYRINDC